VAATEGISDGLSLDTAAGAACLQDVDWAIDFAREDEEDLVTPLIRLEPIATLKG